MANLVTPMPMIRARFFDDNGRPLSGGKIYTYEPNTTTPKTTYKDLAATTPNTNPILLDVAGEADIYFDGQYRVIVESWRGEQLYDVDNIGSPAQIGAQFILDASGKTQQEINEQTINALRYATGDYNYDTQTGTDDTVKINEYLTVVNTDRLSCAVFPTQHNDYLITSPVGLKDPTLIAGTSGATYGNAHKKHGSIVVGGTATHGLDLGLSRTYTEYSDVGLSPTDNWSIKNLRLRPLNPAEKTKIGIRHTSATNGPDRGLLLREVSLCDFDQGFYANFWDGTLVQIATLVIEGCVLSRNNTAINCEGTVYGARIVGNQIEANTTHCIRGRLTGGVTIQDNMLEGSKDCINLESRHHNMPIQAVIGQNYFESNYGDYVMRFSHNNKLSKFVVNPNFCWDTTKFRDYIFAAGAQVIINNDYNPVTMNAQSWCYAGSRLTNDYCKSFFVRGNAVDILGAQVAQPYDEMLKFGKPPSYVDIPLTIGTVKKVDGQYRYTLTNNSEYQTVTGFTCNQNDVIVLNAVVEGLVDGTTSSFIFNFLDNSGNIAQFQAVAALRSSNGNRTLLTAVAVAGKATGANPRIGFYSANDSISRACLSLSLGVSGTASGSIPAITEKFEVFPHCPALGKPISEDILPFSDITTITVPANGTEFKNITVTHPFLTAAVGDLAFASLNTSSLTVDSVKVVNTNIVQVVYRNNSATEFSGTFTTKIRVLK